MPLNILRQKPNKLFLVCILGFGWTSAPGQADKDREAIKAVIVKETTSFMNVDMKAWSDSWVKSPSAYWSFADSTGSSSLEGWDAITRAFQVYFTHEKPSKAKITDSWVDIRVYGKGAYARFTQRVVDELDIEETSQVRVLEKKGGKWKIVCAGVVAKYGDKQRSSP